MCKSATDISLLIKNSYPVQFQFQKFEIDSAKIKSNIKKFKILIFYYPKIKPTFPQSAALFCIFDAPVLSSCMFISQSGATPGWLKRAGPTKTPRESFARYPGKLCPYLSLISITIPNQS